MLGNSLVGKPYSPWAQKFCLGHREIKASSSEPFKEDIHFPFYILLGFGRPCHSFMFPLSKLGACKWPRPVRHSCGLSAFSAVPSRKIWPADSCSVERGLFASSLQAGLSWPQTFLNCYSHVNEKNLIKTTTLPCQSMDVNILIKMNRTIIMLCSLLKTLENYKHFHFFFCLISHWISLQIPFGYTLHQRGLG